jgi:hypothetical protein
VNTESSPSLMAAGDTVMLIDGSGDALGDGTVRGMPAIASRGVAPDRIMNAKTAQSLTAAQRWQRRWAEDMDRVENEGVNSL